MIKKRKSRLFWNLDRCKIDALRFKTKIDWIKNSESSYKSALKNNWLEICSEHMIDGKIGCNRKYTLDECLIFAKKYSYSEEWKKSHNSSYKCSILAGWYSICCSHMTKLRGAWNTIEKCHEISKKFRTKTEWRNNHPSSYAYAHKKGWINECSTHMVHATRENSMEVELKKCIQLYYSNAESKRFMVKNAKYLAKCFELDIFIPEKNKGVEFDGTYWHSDSALQKRFPSWSIDDVKKYHDLKDEFFLSIGIEVLHVKEIDWRKNKSEQINTVYKFLEVQLCQTS